MYENLIQPTPISNKPNNLSVRLAAMPVSKKVAYVHSVCAALIDDRFGRRMSPFLMDIREMPEQMADEFCEMTFEDTFEGIWPSYVVVPDSAIARRHAGDIIRRKLTHAEAVNLSIRLQTLPASNLGRGSPKHLWDASRVCSPHLSVART